MLAESAVVGLLKHAHLFKEAVQDKRWTYSFPKPDSAAGLTTISYNSKQSDAHTLFFCKGRNFKRAYLDEAIRAGVPVIVTENVFPETPASVAQLVVTDIKKAMEPLFTTAPDEDRAGLGFAVMQSFCDKVRVRSKPDSGTTVTLEKIIGSENDR